MAIEPAPDDGQRALREVRCARCNTLLFKADARGRVEIVCSNRECRRWQALRLVGAAPSR